MGNYTRHLEELYDHKTFKRKKEYIDFNFKTYFSKIGLEIKILEVGPGLGEFESYLNDKDVSDIDIIDNDDNILDYVSKKYKINRKFLAREITPIEQELTEYKFIFLMQVLEHYPKDKYALTLKLLYKHLEKGGFLVIVVPNANNPLGLTERYGDLQHTGSFTEQSLKDLVNCSGIKDYSMEIKGYEIPPYSLINIIRIALQKILHAILLLIMIINGGLFFKIMTPNISLILKKN